MNQAPLFSIVMPSFNQAQYLEQAIDSVLSQDYPRIEFFILDGGSKDRSVEIIKKYESHLAGWVSEKDNGQADAVNKGFARSTGDYLGWLNSDDLFEPGALTTAAQALEQHTQVGLVYGDVRSIDSDGHTFNVMRFGNWGLEELMCFKVIGQPGAFLRRSVQQRAGFLDASYHYLLDHHYWLLIAQQAPILYIPKILAAARYHPQAKNMSMHAHYIEDARRVAAWMENEPRLADVYQRLRPRIWAGAYRLGAHYLLDGNMPKEALKLYWQCLRLHPPTALGVAHRMVYAVLALMGLGKLKSIYLKAKRSRYGYRQ